MSDAPLEILARRTVAGLPANELPLVPTSADPLAGPLDEVVRRRLYGTAPIAAPPTQEPPPVSLDPARVRAAMDAIAPAGQSVTSPNQLPTAAATWRKNGAQPAAPRALPPAADSWKAAASQVAEPTQVPDGAQSWRQTNGAQPAAPRALPPAAASWATQPTAGVATPPVGELAGPKSGPGPEESLRIAASGAELSARSSPAWNKLDSDADRLDLLNIFRERNGLKPTDALPQPKGVAQVASEEFGTSGGIARKLPFVSAVGTAADLWDVYHAARLAEDGRAGPAEWKVLADYQDQLVESARGHTFAGGAANIVAQSIPFMGEFMLSGGAASLIKAGAKKAATRVLSTAIKESIEAGAAAATKGAVGAAVGKVARFAGEQALRMPAFAPQIARDTIKGMVPDYNLHPGDDGAIALEINRSGQPFWSALRDSMADNYIEVASESTGGAIGKLGNAAGRVIKVPAGKLADFVTRGKASVIAEMVSRFPQRYPSIKAATAFLEKAGYHGVFHEIGEERAGQLMRLAARDAIDYTGGDSRIDPGEFPGVGQVLQEFVAFIAQGAAVGGTAAGFNRFFHKPAAESPEAPPAQPVTQPAPPSGPAAPPRVAAPAPTPNTAQETAPRIAAPQVLPGGVERFEVEGEPVTIKRRDTGRVNLDEARPYVVEPFGDPAAYRVINTHTGEERATYSAPAQANKFRDALNDWNHRQALQLEYSAGESARVRPSVPPSTPAAGARFYPAFGELPAAETTFTGPRFVVTDVSDTDKTPAEGVAAGGFVIRDTARGDVEVRTIVGARELAETIADEYNARAGSPTIGVPETAAIPKVPEIAAPGHAFVVPDETGRPRGVFQSKTKAEAFAEDRGRGSASVRYVPQPLGSRYMDTTTETVTPGGEVGQGPRLTKVPASGNVPAYRISRFPNGVHFVQFRRRPGNDVVKRITDQGGHWSPKAKGYIFGHFNPSQIQWVVAGRKLPPAAVPEPPRSPLPAAPAPRAELTGLRTLTERDAGELLGIAEAKPMVLATLQRRGYRYVRSRKLTWLVHPQGDYRYRVGLSQVRGEVKDHGGNWSPDKASRSISYKRYAESIRQKLQAMHPGVKPLATSAFSLAEERAKREAPTTPPATANQGVSEPATPNVAAAMPPAETTALEPRPFGSESLQSAFGLTAEQAAAAVAVAEAMGLDTTRTEVARKLPEGTAGPVESLNNLYQSHEEGEAERFYSQIRRSVESLPKDESKVTLGWLQKQGVKPEELKWTGLDEYIGKAKQPPTKRQVLDMLDITEMRIQELWLSPRDMEGRNVVGQPEYANKALTDYGSGQPSELLLRVVPPMQPNEKIRALEARKMTESEVYRLELELAETRKAFAATNRPLTDLLRSITAEQGPEAGEVVSEYMLALERGRDVNYESLKKHNVSDELINRIRAMVRENEINRKPMMDAHWRHAEARNELSGVGRSGPLAGWKIGHYEDRATNIIAHARITELQGVLQIEELQSDWHQGGRKSGYMTAEEESELVRLDGELDKIHSRELMAYDERRNLMTHVKNEWMAIKDNPKEVTWDSDFANLGSIATKHDPTAPLSLEDSRLRRITSPSVRAQFEKWANKFEAVQYEISDLIDKAFNISNRIYAIRKGDEPKTDRRPPAPFAKTSDWVRLLLKRLVSKAVEDGQTRVTWTPGWVQNQRYNLSFHVQKIMWVPDHNVITGKRREGDAGALVVQRIGGFTWIEVGRLDSSEKLADYIGTDLAEQVLAAPEITSAQAYFGSEQARLAGQVPDNMVHLIEGPFHYEAKPMVDFYDRVVPDVARSLVKPYGGEVTTRVYSRNKPNPEIVAEADYTMHAQGFDITPAMRDAYLAGVPLFQSGAAKRARASVLFSDSGRTIINALHEPDISSVLHELFHMARRQLFDRSVPAEVRGALITEADVRTIEDWAGAKGGVWDRDAEEKFARAGERYLYTGQAPIPQLAKLFAKLREWLRSIYQRIAGSAIDIGMPPNVRRVFDQLFRRGTPGALSTEIEATPAKRTKAAEPENLAPMPFGVESLKKAFGLTAEQALATQAIVEALELDQAKLQVARGPATMGEPGAMLLNVEHRTAVSFTSDGQAVIRALNRPNVSTAIHELMNVARRQLVDKAVPKEIRGAMVSDADVDTIEKWAGVTDGRWTQEAEGKFAAAGEKYLRSGKAPDPRLRELFKRVATWLRNVYRKVRGSPIDVEITPAVGKVLDRLFKRGQWSKDVRTLSSLQEVGDVEARVPTGPDAAKNLDAYKRARGYNAETSPDVLAGDRAYQRLLDAAKTARRRRIATESVATRKAKQAARAQAGSVGVNWTREAASLLPVAKLPPIAREIVRDEARRLLGELHGNQGEKTSRPALQAIADGKDAKSNATIEAQRMRIFKLLTGETAPQSVGLAHYRPDIPYAVVMFTPQGERRAIIDDAILAIRSGRANRLADQAFGMAGEGAGPEAAEAMLERFADELGAGRSELPEVSIPALRKEDVDAAALLPDLITAGKLQPGFAHTETGEIFAGSHELSSLPPTYWTDYNGTEVRGVDVAIQPGWVDEDGRFMTRDDALNHVAFATPIDELVKRTGLTFDPKEHRDRLAELLDRNAERPLEITHRSRTPGGYMRPSLWEQFAGDVGSKYAPPPPDAYESLQLIRIALAHAEVAELFQNEEPQELAGPPSPEALEELTRQSTAKPAYSIGNLTKTRDQATWWTHVVNHMIKRIQNPPAGTIRERVYRTVGRGLWNTRWAIGEDVFRQFERVRGERRAAGLQSEELAAKLEAGAAAKIREAQAANAKADPDEIRRQYHRDLEDALRGDKTRDELPTEQQKLFDLYAKPITEITDEILSSPWMWPYLRAFGLQNIEQVIAIKRNGPGVYLRRLYKQAAGGVTVRPEWNKEPGALFGNDETRNIGPRLRGGQFAPRRGDEELYTLVDATGPRVQYQQFQTQQEASTAWERMIEANVEQFGLEVYKKIRVLDPFSVDELEQMGAIEPIRDVGLLMTRSLIESASNLQTLKLLAYLADTQAVDADPDPKGRTWVGLPNHPAFGPLAGKWVPEPTAYAINEHERVRRGFVPWLWNHFNGSWKFAKVILSPATWARNLRSNLVFQFLDRMNFAADAQWIAKAIREFRERGPAFWRLVKENELTTGWSGSEVKDLQQLVDAGEMDIPATLLNWAEKHKDAVQIGKAGVKAAKRLGSVYDAIDQVHKLASYLKKTQKLGWSHDEAVRGLWMYPNYDRIGTAARWSRRSPFGKPFIAFTDQATQIYLRALRDRPARMLAMMGFLALWPYAVRMLMGIGDDEMKLIDESDPRRQGFFDRLFRPMLPMRNSKGAPLFLDVSYEIPLADEVGLLTPGAGLKIPYILGQPWTSTVFELALNSDGYTANKIVDRKDSLSVKAAKWARHVAENMAPVPSLLLKRNGGGLTRIYRAAAGKSNEGVPRAVLREVFGLKISDPWIRREDAYTQLKEALKAQEWDRFFAIMTLWQNTYRADYDEPIEPRNIARGIRTEARNAARKAYQESQR